MSGVSVARIIGAVVRDEELAVTPCAPGRRRDCWPGITDLDRRAFLCSWRGLLLIQMIGLSWLQFIKDIMVYRGLYPLMA